VRSLTEDRFLADLRTRDALHAAFLDRLITGINNVAAGAGVAVTGDLTPPPPINAITVKANGEMVHATLSHGAEVSRSIHYFLEADNSPSFPQPHVMELKSSRGHVFHLPALNDSGVQQPWYLRAYAQNPGSRPSPPTVLGGLANPTPLMLKGSTKLTLLPSTGSGTASSTGQQGGAGLGKQRISTPKVTRIGKLQASNTPVSSPVVGAAPHLLADITQAASVTSISQVGTSTAISINGTQTFFLGGLTIQMSCPSNVDPGAFGTYYAFIDNPDLLSGNFTAQVTTNITVLGQAPGRFPLGKVVTSGAGGGTGGGSGGGGGCFSGDTKILMADGAFRRFDTLPLQFSIWNRTGFHPAELIVHENYNSLMIDMGRGLVTPGHGISPVIGDDYIPAKEVFSGMVATWRGTVYNLHVIDGKEEDAHYILEDGSAAHNFNKF
jgi:hypothetical protein